ncbi:hypothetical protein NP493_16g00045 [Ridgeia piscesae]|uniref:Uncharacterized protein n=1 Tax=Ridgeia piscesae TaxID=27915 RepID=A0AAD9UKT4_RIDPI|nr:hypothetical protein NP493_16g00045 [Ridgeia piscesae]
MCPHEKGCVSPATSFGVFLLFSPRVLASPPTICVLESSDSFIGLLHLEGGPRECLFTAKGFEYRGHVSVTKSGRKCQSWRAQWVNSDHIVSFTNWFLSWTAVYLIFNLYSVD